MKKAIQNFYPDVGVKMGVDTIVNFFLSILFAALLGFANECVVEKE